MATKEPQRFVYDPSEVNLFQLLEDRRVEAQQQMETLHKRIGSLRDELYDEVASSHKEIMTEIRELKEDQRQHARDMDERLSNLERWKWIVVGGASAVGFVIAIGLDIANFFK
jgi:hypothetical protein